MKEEKNLKTWFKEFKENSSKLILIHACFSYNGKIKVKGEEKK